MKKIKTLTEIEYIIKNQLLIFKEDGSFAFIGTDLLNITLSEILYTIIDNFFYKEEFVHQNN